MDRSHEAANDRERARLQALVSRLTDEQLGAPTAGGWTVAAELAHVAFWDARAVFLMAKWRAGVEPSVADHEPPDIDWINDAAKPMFLALQPRKAAELSLQIAAEADAGVAALSDEMLGKLHEIIPPFNLSRAEHRAEHIDDIERALPS